MNLTQLSYFRELAQREHLLKTAEALHISPPSLSAGLKSLEKEIGTPLFDRVGRNIRLNAQGKAFLPHVNALFLSLDKGLEAVAQSLEDEKNMVSFSLKDMAFFAGALSQFTAQHPEVQLTHLEGDPDDEGQLLWEKNLDFMITAKDLTGNKKLDWCYVNNDLYVISVAPSHPLAARGHCTLADLKDECFLQRSRNNYFQQCVDALLASFSFQPKTTREADYATRPILLRGSQSVAVSTELTQFTGSYEGLVPVYVKEFQQHRYPVRAYWRKDKPMSPSAKLLLQAFHAYIQSIQNALDAKKCSET